MKTIVIAEVGENHYGRWDVCRGMVEEIARQGATYAKFQTYTADNFGKDHEWYDWFKGVAMPEAEHFEMQQLCAEKNVGFLSSTFTIGTTRFLVEKMKCTSLKVASSRLIDYDLLDDIDNRADKVKTVYLSSGMGTVAFVAYLSSRSDIPDLPDETRVERDFRRVQEFVRATLQQRERSLGE